MKSNLLPPLSRRLFLGAAASSAAVMLLPMRPAHAAGETVSAIVFDGDALIAAGSQVWRHDPTGDATHLATPRAPIRALACHPGQPGRLFAAPDGGGVLLSDDGGLSWSGAQSGLPGRQVTALAIAAAEPGTLYAAIVGDGLWRSEDAGGTWSFVMDRPWIDEAERDVLALTSVNLASGMGGIWLYAGTETGLTRVPDCFCRWQDVVAGDAMDALVAGTAPPPEAPLPEGEAVLALVSAHSAPERLYAALPSGVWASPDGGVTWAQHSNLRAIALAVNPTNPNHIAAATAAELTESRDGGASWATLASI